MAKPKQQEIPQTLTLPTEGFIRVKQITRFIPFSRTTIWRKVKAGQFPRPVKLSDSVTAWRAARGGCADVDGASGARETGMNALTRPAPRLQTGFTTLYPALPPRQRGFVVSAFPLSWLSPVRRGLSRIGGAGLEGELRPFPRRRESAPP